MAGYADSSLRIVPIRCHFETLGRVSVAVSIENAGDTPAGIAIPPVALPEWTPEVTEFSTLFDKKFATLVSIGETQCGPGPATLIVMSPRERFTRDAEVTYSQEPEKAERALVLVSFDWAWFPAWDPSTFWEERTCWLLQVDATSAECAVADARVPCLHFGRP